MPDVLSPNVEPDMVSGVPSENEEGMEDFGDTESSDDDAVADVDPLSGDEETLLGSTSCSLPARHPQR